MYPFKLIEQDVSDYWDKEKVFEQSTSRNLEEFILWEGPPTANGKPGIHHVLTRTFKDIVGRFWTMNGKKVIRKAGWDEHGLPVEIEVQKELKLTSKQEIQTYGIDKFNQKCRESTKKYTQNWQELTKKMGYWVDMANPYRTSDDSYIDKVWQVLKTLNDQKRIYQDSKVVAWACDSETVVSNAEAAQGYKEITSTSAYVLFELEDGRFLCAWTTTPWTLPANQALAINKDFNYYLKDNIISLENEGGELIKGTELVGLKYKNIFYGKELVVAWQTVYHADFVLNSKTGVVHIAPAFGADDYLLHKKEFPEVEPYCHVNSNGEFNILAPGYLKNLKVYYSNFEKANKLVLEDIKKNVLKTEEYKHQYPHNWRTDVPLIYYLRPSWFVNVNSIRSKMIEENQKVNWFPDNIKNGRFGEWLTGNVDWAISRERYWGTPLPFNKDGFEIPSGHHKPEAETDVLDCWFDSGSMPFAAFEKHQQADCICEAIDQTRGWFYSLMVIGVGLTGETPYKNVLCLGHVLDKNGQKMSKSKNNSVDPFAVFEKFGVDAVRWYFAKNQIGNSILFNEKDIQTGSLGFLNRFWNSWTFYKDYAKIEKVFPTEPESAKPIDNWILALLEKTRQNCLDYYEAYEFHKVTNEIEKFVDSLSNGWIRSNRERFFGKDLDLEAFNVLHKCLNEVLKLSAPIIPFFTESVYRELNGESVHLQMFDKNRTQVSTKIIEAMELTLDLVEQGRGLRTDNKVKIKQPLKAFYYPSQHVNSVFTDFICKELNVKMALPHNLPYVAFDFTIDAALEAEGLMRGLMREVQAMRKEHNFIVTDRIEFYVEWNPELFEKIKNLFPEMNEKLGIVKTVESVGKKGKKLVIDGYEIWVEIKISEKIV